MGSSSTQKNLPLALTQSPLLVLRSHHIMFDHINTVLDAIRNFPRPQNITDMPVLVWTRQSSFIRFRFCRTHAPFREALKPGSTFTWTDELISSLKGPKPSSSMKSRMVFVFLTSPSQLASPTDWSRLVLAFGYSRSTAAVRPAKLFCCRIGWKFTVVGSRFTHAAESRYAIPH